MKRTTQMKRGTSVPDEEEWVEDEENMEGLTAGVGQMARGAQIMTRGVQPMIRITRAPGTPVVAFPPCGYLLKPDNCEKEEIIYHYHGRKHPVIDISVCEYYCKEACSTYVKHCSEHQIQRKHIRYTAFI